MKNEERMNFECEHCGTLFDRHLFDIAKSLERVDYLGPIPSSPLQLGLFRFHTRCARCLKYHRKPTD